MATVNLNIFEQLSLNGTGVPYTVNLPPGQDGANPTGVRNISPTPLTVTFNASGGEDFFDSSTQTSAATFQTRIPTGQSAFAVWLPSKTAWVFYTFSTESFSAYVLGAAMPPVAAGSTVPITLAVANQTATDNVDFLIVGNTLQAVNDIDFNYEMSCNISFVAPNNSYSNFQVNANITGLGTLVNVDWKDYFSTPRADLFEMSMPLPKGICSLSAGDTIFFDVTNQAGSSVDLDFDGMILIIDPT